MDFKGESLELRRNSNIPLYKQLYLILKNIIETGEKKEGDLFYSESELVKTYGVSRSTVRNAMVLLEQNGYILRSQGASTIVKSNKNVSWNMLEKTYDLRTDKARLKSKIISIDKVIPNKKIKKFLRLSEEDFVYKISRLRSIEQNKINISSSYIVAWAGIDFTCIGFDETTSIYETLEKVGVKPVVADDSIEAVIGPPEICLALDVSPGSAMFYRERVAYDEKKRPVEYVESYYNAKYVRYYSHNEKI